VAAKQPRLEPGRLQDLGANLVVLRQRVYAYVGGKPRPLGMGVADPLQISPFLCTLRCRIWSLLVQRYKQQ